MNLPLLPSSRYTPDYFLPEITDEAVIKKRRKKLSNLYKYKETFSGTVVVPPPRRDITLSTITNNTDSIV